MKDIKEIVAKNLITLRKKHGMTQVDLAKKLNYSDNTISRWEKAEICPTLDSLQNIAMVFDVPIEYLIQENVIENVEQDTKTHKIKLLMTALLVISLIWFSILVSFIYFQSLLGVNIWILFIWAVPASFIVLFIFGIPYHNRIYSFVVFSLFIWTFLASFYLQFLESNLFLIFILGVPAELAWSVWCFVRPKSKK